jgi:type IX secretion system PorP/SprF family membrane protein
LKKLLEMKRTLFISLLLILVSNLLFAQQEPIFTQYMFNPFMINPAVAGTNNYYQIRLNSRFQWAGITDAPVTNCLSAYGPSSGKNKDMGYGGYIISDVTGPTSRTGFYGGYAYNISVNNEIRLSMGLSAGLVQYKIDGSKITSADSNDPVMQGGVSSQLVPDASVGLYLYASNFQVGFSAQQLINNKLKIYDTQTGLSKLKSHFNLTGGYKYFIDRDWAIEPTAIIQGVGPVPLQLDLTGKVIYQSLVWGALAYRTADAVSILIGYAYQKKIYIGYSYDIGVSAIHKYQSGSHEIMINYHFQTLK